MLTGNRASGMTSDAYCAAADKKSEQRETGTTECWRAGCGWRSLVFLLHCGRMCSIKGKIVLPKVDITMFTIDYHRRLVSALSVKKFRQHPTNKQFG